MFDRYIAQSAYHNAMRANGGTYRGHQASIDGVSRSEAMRLARKLATEIFGHGWLAAASIGRTLKSAASLCEAIAQECKGYYVDAFTGCYVCQSCGKQPQADGCDHLCLDCYSPSKPAYAAPSDAAIATYATTYRELGASCGHHTSMSYAVMPTREDFDRAFAAVCVDGWFKFGNDPFVGFDSLDSSELWSQLETQLVTWGEGKHADECPGDGSCRGDGCPSEEAGSWCSCVLGVLGFEWI